MNVKLYSEDLSLLQQWQKKITIYASEILEDIENLYLYNNMIVILDYSCCHKNLFHIMNLSESQNIKILLLDNTPTFEKGKKVLGLGVHGYGNILMNELFLNSAIETIKNNMIWIYPEFTTSLIQGFSKEQTAPNEIAQLLTSRELDITLLIKDGLSNNEISQHLDISINTVKSHIKNIYEKLNVKNRLSLSLLFKTK
ncbi:MAG: response regulator transcription factor [Arcobacteraceae bacterium]|nr:response regulator transcription factor [Arcobacteraceae bacterium]